MLRGAVVFDRSAPRPLALEGSASDPVRGGKIMTDIVIASAACNTVGSLNGAFGRAPAPHHGEVDINGVLDRAGDKPAERRAGLLGQSTTAADGPNTARPAPKLGQG